MNAWIKYIIVILVRYILKILYVFNINNNRILAYSFGGRQYSCSPKYIIEYILQKEKENLEIIFAVNDVSKYSYLSKKNIKLIKYKSLKYHFYAMTCKIFITNALPPPYIPFRKKQFILSTWHGGGAYKKSGLDTINNLPSRMLIKLQIKSLTKIITSCKRFSEIFHKAYLIPKKSFINSGLPRNDIFFGGRDKEIYIKIRYIYNIPMDGKIVLYAPTFRSEMNSIEGNFSAGKYNIDYLRLKKALKEKFKGNWYIFFRSHYYLNDRLKNGLVRDVSNYPDMQELLCAADILITDYSSSMWDFSLTFKPGFIFANDIDLYEKNRGFYTSIKDWAYPIARNNDELIMNIINFNQEDNIKRIKKHQQLLGSYEKGNATNEVMKIIKDFVKVGLDK